MRRRRAMGMGVAVVVAVAVMAVVGMVVGHRKMLHYNITRSTCVGSELRHLERLRPSLPAKAGIHGLSLIHTASGILGPRPGDDGQVWARDLATMRPGLLNLPP